MPIHKPIHLLTCVLLAASPVVGQSDWPMFRGVNGSGHAQATLPADLSLEKHLAWKVAVPKGYSSPVIVGDRIFLTAEDGDDLITLCLNKTTGKEAWRKTAPRPRKEKLDQRSHAAAASAVVSRDSVVVFFGDYGLLCYSLDGEERWRRPLGPFNNLYGMGASPVIIDGKAILVCDQQKGSFVVAVDLKTGDIAWRTDRPEATSGHCTPIVYRPEGKPGQVLVAGSFSLTAYLVQSGKKVWWVNGLSFEMKSTPVIADGLLFINGYASPYNQPDKKVKIAPYADVVAKQDANENGVLEKSEMPDQLSRSFFDFINLDSNDFVDKDEWRYFEVSMASDNSMMAMTLGGKGDVTKDNLRWRYHKNIPQLPSPIATDGHLYMISDAGIVTNFEAKTGRVHTRGRLKGASGSVYVSPIVVGEHILFLTTKGTLAMVPINDKIEVQNTIKFNEPCFATPAVVDGRLFVRTNESLFCLGTP